MATPFLELPRSVPLYFRRYQFDLKWDFWQIPVLFDVMKKESDRKRSPHKDNGAGDWPPAPSPDGGQSFIFKNSSSRALSEDVKKAIFFESQATTSKRRRGMGASIAAPEIISICSQKRPPHNV
jgi:hypothetical protein